MRELELFEQYLIRYRQDRLQLSHSTLVNGVVEDWAMSARVYACQAESADRMREALEVLKEDPGRFIEEFLK